jgi:hypothetical protein
LTYHLAVVDGVYYATEKSGPASLDVCEQAGNGSALGQGDAEHQEPTGACEEEESQEVNDKLRRFEDELNRVLIEADGELEIAEVIGVLQIKLHVCCQRLMTRSIESDPADYWKFMGDE